MQIRMLRIGTTAAMVLAMFLAPYAGAADTAAKSQPIEKLELQISGDGKALVDQDGKEVARFVDSVKMRTPVQRTKMQGCMCCSNDCIVYDGNKCIKRIRSCTWDFDCNCN